MGIIVILLFCFSGYLVFENKRLQGRNNELTEALIEIQKICEEDINSERKEWKDNE